MNGDLVKKEVTLPILLDMRRILTILLLKQERITLYCMQPSQRIMIPSHLLKNIGETTFLSRYQYQQVSWKCLTLSLLTVME